MAHLYGVRPRLRRLSAGVSTRHLRATQTSYCEVEGIDAVALQVRGGPGVPGIYIFQVDGSTRIFEQICDFSKSLRKCGRNLARARWPLLEWRDGLGARPHGGLGLSTPLYRPPPIPTRTGSPIDRRTHFEKSARRLLAGETLWVKDHYKTGVGIIEALVAALRPPQDTADYDEKRRYREAYREHAWRLLAPVEHGKLALTGAPEIGFLEELYPDHGTFWLPFPEVRDLAKAWHRYDTGVHMAVLGHPLHPFYGAYLPKRNTHLELFATWLSGWEGARGVAIDVGTGSGVLALMLARAGFSSVIATDINPNACESVRREISRRPEPPPVAVRDADLLDGVDVSADLIVFNPPWTLGPVENLLDRALHYDDDLFQRFFDQAHTRLAPGGRIALVFSNVIRLVQPGVSHPIDAELERGRFELVTTQVRRIKPTPGGPRPARRTRERVEVWELAVRR